MSGATGRVVVTGTAWMGSGIGSIESALERLFREARGEIALTAYAISGGADLLLDWLEAALGRGVEVRMLINRLEDQPADEASRLRQLAGIYPHFRLHDFRSGDGADLHAKAVVIDRWLALVGSSNLSRRGLLLNHEIAVLVQGPPAADVAGALDRLLASRYAIRV